MTRFDHDETDPSGARQKRNFLAAAGRELQRSHAAGESATIVAVQVKGLLGVRLALGETEAQTMAAEAAEALTEVFGDQGMVGRMGATEFAVYVSGDADPEELRSMAIRDGDESTNGDEREWRLVLKAGVASRPASSETSLEDLVSRARSDLRHRTLGLPGILQRVRA